MKCLNPLKAHKSVRTRNEGAIKGCKERKTLKRRRHGLFLVYIKAKTLSVPKTLFIRFTSRRLLTLKKKKMSAPCHPNSHKRIPELVRVNAKCEMSRNVSREASRARSMNVFPSFFWESCERFRPNTFPEGVGGRSFLSGYYMFV